MLDACTAQLKLRFLNLFHLAKLKIQRDKLANLLLLINAFEVNFKEPDHKFEFCEGINLLLFFISYFDA